MKNTKRTWWLIAAIAMVAFVAGCADGDLELGSSANITPAPPSILKFAADPTEVAPGGSTKLVWEVDGADSVEITTSDASDFKFHAGPFTELTGEAPVDGITTTTEFVLTASKTVMVALPATGDGGTTSPSGDGSTQPTSIVVSKAGQIEIPQAPPVPNLSPMTVTATAKATVTIVESNLTAKITTDKDTLIAGESTIIHWKAEPSTAQVTVKASDSSVINAQAEGSCVLPSEAPEAPQPVTPQPSEAAATAAAFPVEGCAVVTPLANTTYSLEATDSGKIVDDAVTIQVSVANVDALIKANDQENVVQVSDFSTPVKISYQAQPADALVTIVTDQPVICTPELPSTPQALTGGVGVSQCTLTQKTRFDMKAKMGSAEETSSVVVDLEGGQIADAKITAAPWAFEGEEVTVTADPDAIQGNNRAFIKEIIIAGSSYKLPASGPLVVPNVPVPIGGIDATVVTTSGAEIPHPKVVQTAIPISIPIGDDVQEYSRITFDDKNPSRAYIGVKKIGYNKGVLQAYKVNMKDVSDYLSWKIDISTSLLASAQSSTYWNEGTANGFFEMVKDFPVSALVVDGDRLFMGATGIVMYSDDEGTTWNKITTFLRFYADDYETCAGEMQPGNGDDLGSLGRACDLVARNKHLIIASDRGVLTVTDVDNFISTQDAAQYVAGRPPQGAIDETKYPTYGAVAHDLEAVDGAVYAASTKGLFKSTDDGETWTKVDGISEEIFAVAVRDNMIYVGTATGIKSRPLDGGSWVAGTMDKKSKIYSIATDPYSPGVVLAGTNDALLVSRDNGATWTRIKAGGFSGKAIKSVAIAAKPDDTGSQLEYSISFGGQQGAVAASMIVSAKSDGLGTRSAKVVKKLRLLPQEMLQVRRLIQQ